MGAREGLPLWDLARDLHHRDFLLILWHIPASELLLLLHGLHDLHPAPREQKGLNKLGLGSLQKAGRPQEKLNVWSEFESQAHVCQVREKL